MKFNEYLVEQLTKKHFTALANIIKTPKNKNEMANSLVDWLEGMNPRFNTEAFKKAAGMK